MRAGVDGGLRPRVAIGSIHDASPQGAVARKLVAGLRLVERSQHPNGEILSFRRDPHGNYVYTRSPFVSAFVHDALGCLDPTSPAWNPGGLDVFPAQERRRVERTVSDLRQRIRGFLLWQQEADGRWRFFGRRSGIDPDVNTTAVAALALADHQLARSARAWRVVEDAVLAFRSEHGLFYTFSKPGRGGYGWMDDAGFPVVGFDRVVNAEVARILPRLGDRAAPALDAVVESTLAHLRHGDLLVGSSLYPNPMSFLFVVARAWAAGGLAHRAEVAPIVARTIESLLDGEAGERPLSVAMAGTALVDLGWSGPPLGEVHRRVLAGMRPEGGWGYDDFVVHGFGSPAWTTALSLSFLTRCPQPPEPM